jgi:ubiquinone/menaquinone biosynthesis C-methylase UbiE
MYKDGEGIPSEREVNPEYPWNDLQRIERFEVSRRNIEPAFSDNIRVISNRFLPDRGSILDIGAGTGALRQRMPENYALRTIHTDISSTYMKVFKEKHPDAQASFADATTLPFKDGAFDAIISLSTFHTIIDLDSAVSEARRVLKPGGSFVNILDITPSPIPMLDYMISKQLLIFPAANVRDNFGVPQRAYKAPTRQEVGSFIENHPYIDKELFDSIALAVRDPMHLYLRFEADRSGRLRSEFAHNLQQINFPGEPTPITELFQQRLTESLMTTGFENIEAENVTNNRKTLKEAALNETSIENIKQRVTGVTSRYYYSSLPDNMQIISSTVQCISATKSQNK